MQEPRIGADYPPAGPQRIVAFSEGFAREQTCAQPWLEARLEFEPQTLGSAPPLDVTLIEGWRPGRRQRQRTGFAATVYWGRGCGCGCGSSPAHKKDSANRNSPPRRSRLASCSPPSGRDAAGVSIPEPGGAGNRVSRFPPLPLRGFRAARAALRKRGAKRRPGWGWGALPQWCQLRSINTRERPTARPTNARCRSRDLNPDTRKEYCALNAARLPFRHFGPRSVRF